MNEAGFSYSVTEELPIIVWVKVVISACNAIDVLFGILVLLVKMLVSSSHAVDLKLDIRPIFVVKNVSFGTTVINGDYFSQ